MIRIDADELISILRSNGVDRLYHVTDASNWDSIKRFGIFSAQLLKQKNVPDVCYGSDRISQIISQRKGLDHYVHLSFSNTPSSLPRAFEKGYLDNLITLEISLDVFNEGDTAVASRDPLDDNSALLSETPQIASIDFEAAKDGATFVAESPSDKAKAGAAVLVPGVVPRTYILNADEIDAEISRKAADEDRRKAVVLLVDLTSTMEDSVSLRGRSYDSFGDAARSLANAAVTQLMNSAITRSTVRDDVDVFMFAYSDNTESLWEIPADESGYKTCPQLYREMIMRLEKEGARPHWSKDITPHGHANLAQSIRMISQVVEKWSFEHRGCIKPLVVHISNGKNILSNLLSVSKELSILRDSSAYLWNYMICGDISVVNTLTSSDDLAKLGKEGEALFSMSAEARGPLVRAYCELAGRSTSDNKKAMLVNSDIALLISAFLGL